jgi:hypothetical protein
LPSRVDPAKKARIVLEPIVEPLVLGLEADQYSYWPAVAGDDDLLFLCKPQVLRRRKRSTSRFQMERHGGGE